MKTLQAHDPRITALVPRIRAVILAGLTAGVLATAPLPAQASFIFDFVPDDTAFTDVSGFFEISETAFVEGVADTAVEGEVLDFFFEFITNGVFDTFSFRLADLKVSGSDMSFVLTIDESGEFLPAVQAASSGGDTTTNLLIVNSAGDSFFWNPAMGEVTLSVCDLCDVTVAGRFTRSIDVPEPGSLFLFGVGLAGLVLIRRRHRRGHR